MTGWRQAAGYIGLLGAVLMVSLAAGWTTLGTQFDNDVYDFLFRIHAPRPGEAASAILGIDEKSLAQMGGLRGIRSILAEGLERLAAAEPRAVVIDLILAEPADEKEDARLARAFAGTRNLVLATDLAGDGWEDPLEIFARTAKGVGHVHADPDPYDNVVRQIPLEKIGGRRRFWALALEALRAARGTELSESPEGIEVGGVLVPGRREDGRPMLIRYRRPEGYDSTIPLVTVWELRTEPEAASRLRDRVVFVGITAQSAAQDRHPTPFSYGRTMPGVEIHANAFETMAEGRFLEPASNLGVVAFCVGLAAAAGLIFWRLPGWWAYGLGGVLLVLTHVAPYVAFRQGVVFPYAPPFSTAWLAVVGAAAYQYFFVRRLLGKTAAEKERYQKAIHFVAHEMRTPLMAIQGSSEIMGRYKLPEEKRGDLARTIQSESKRLARLIQTFLDVERLSAGQMELKREPFLVGELVAECLERVRPLAERKQIGLAAGVVEPAVVTGDRELMEYAVYNLLTNAVKYSPAQTTVTVEGRLTGGWLRLSVRDEGIGMDEQELKSIFRKFYRTRRAEASGEAGTGIGLSIVEQIVTHHGGRMEVTSRPGMGSCFTMVIPAAQPMSESEVRPASRTEER